MKFKIIILVLLIMVSVGMSAKTADISGYAALEYDTMSGGGMGEIYAYKELLNERLRVAGRMEIDLYSFAMKGGWVPVGVPVAQTYDLEISCNLNKNIELQFKEGCKHYFEQAPGVNEDEAYIKFGVKYKFGKEAE